MGSKQRVLHAFGLNSTPDNRVDYIVTKCGFDGFVAFDNGGVDCPDCLKILCLENEEL